MRRARLLCFVLVTLPLTNSVTLPVGFPLKLYEVAGALAIAALLVGGVADLGRRGRIPVLWGVFWFGSLFASAWGLMQLAEADLSMLEWAHGRFHPAANTVFHYTYLAFDLGLMVLVLHVLAVGGLDERAFCRWWLYGAALAVGYGVALNLVTAAGLPPAVLLRWDEVQFMTVAGIPVARTGPFEEGNYFGWYLLASTVIAAWAALRWGDRLFRLMLPVLLLGVVMTASPAALLGVLAVLFFAAMDRRVRPGAKVAAVAGAAAVLAFLVTTGLFRTLVIDKFSLLFFGGVTDVTNVSLVQRLNESYHAWLMFLDHPWGVGMGNFGYFFGHYPDLYTWMVSDFSSVKRIANNIYIEVLAEHGLALALLFLYLLWRQGRRLVLAREHLLAFGYLLCCGYFLAFPTFRLALVWVFWGLLVHLGRDARLRPGGDPQGAGKASA
ncbi:MAG: O-antigen ligase family protein [Krumholzibacteria bacterium]|nr:O-antigen ligase family protein [Candidatus Krumholzibacteria bacterium]